MAKTTSVDVLVEGGKASAAPPLGPSLGPLKVNVAQVVTEINKKTADFKGMKVPVTVTVNTETKEFSISVGTPPTSELIKNELKIQKGSGAPNQYATGVMAFEQVMKIANMKQDAFFTSHLHSRVKTVLGSCRSMGILVDGKPAGDVTSALNQGMYDAVLTSGKTDIPQEKHALLAEAQKKIDYTLKELAKKKAAEAAAAASAAATTTPTTTTEAATAAPKEKPTKEAPKKK